MDSLYDSMARIKIFLETIDDDPVRSFPIEQMLIRQ